MSFAAGQIEIRACEKLSSFLVDNASGWGLYTPSRRAVRLRRDCAPLKLLTGIVKRYPIVLGCTGFDGSPVHRGGGIAMIPGLFEK